MVFAAVVVAVVLALALLFVFVLGGDRKDSATLILDSSEKKTIAIIDENTMYQKRCETPCVIEGILAGQHELLFSKNGFVDVKESIFLSKGDNLEKFVKMYRIGEQKTMITVKSDPDGAVLYINDKKVTEITPTIVNDIPVGMDIVVRVEKQGYFPYEENIGKVPANTNKEINIILKPMKNSTVKSKKAEKLSVEESADAGKPAYVTINSSPAAMIYINGKRLKATPISQHELPAGTYKIRFKGLRSDFDKIFEVELKSGETTRLIKNFER